MTAFIKLLEIKLDYVMLGMGPGHLLRKFRDDSVVQIPGHMRSSMGTIKNDTLVGNGMVST